MHFQIPQRAPQGQQGAFLSTFQQGAETSDFSPTRVMRVM